MIITSLDNPKIKYLSSLNKAKERKKEQKFIVEGKHLVDEAKKQNVLIEAYSIEEKEGYIQVTPSIMKKSPIQIHLYLKLDYVKCSIKRNYLTSYYF